MNKRLTCVGILAITLSAQQASADSLVPMIDVSQHTNLIELTASVVSEKSATVTGRLHVTRRDASGNFVQSNHSRYVYLAPGIAEQIASISLASDRTGLLEARFEVFEGDMLVGVTTFELGDAPISSVAE